MSQQEPMPDDDLHVSHEAKHAREKCSEISSFLWVFYQAKKDFFLPLHQLKYLLRAKSQWNKCISELSVGFYLNLSLWFSFFIRYVLVVKETLLLSKQKSLELFLLSRLWPSLSKAPTVLSPSPICSQDLSQCVLRHPFIKLNFSGCNQTWFKLPGKRKWLHSSNLQIRHQHASSKKPSLTVQERL